MRGTEFSIGGSNIEEIKERRRIQYVPTVVTSTVSGWSDGQKGVSFPDRELEAVRRTVGHSKLRGRSLV